MTTLKTFAPDYLTKDAERSGFLQCPTCGVIWFGRPEITFCPGGSDSHGKAVRVAVLCRWNCDKAIPIEHFAEHLNSQEHDLS